MLLPETLSRCGGYLGHIRNILPVAFVTPSWCERGPSGSSGCSPRVQPSGRRAEAWGQGYWKAPEKRADAQGCHHYSGSRELNSPIERDSTHHASKPDRKPSPGRHRTARAGRRGPIAVGVAKRCRGVALRRVARQAKRMGGPARALALGLAIGSLPSNNVSSACCLLWLEWCRPVTVKCCSSWSKHRDGGANSVSSS